MSRSNFVIAIDGFSSCGKSTLAKALAKQLHFVFIDSGAMYRAVTLFFIRNEINCTDITVVDKALQDIHIDFVTSPDKEISIFLNGEDVTAEIRQMYVSDKVSQVSAIKNVRKAMVAQQQKLGRRKNIVMDGRDIGTTVFPDADLKIFMTAEMDIRVHRRYLELTSKGEIVDMEEVAKNLALRDHIDSTREESPLRQAQDAVVLDNSNLTPEQQLQFVVDLYHKIKREKA